MNRREFLKTAYRVGGIAALYSLGAGVIEEAQAWGILPAVVGGDTTASALWADWDEASEDTLLVDQDGDGVEDTFICFFENTSAGGDEYGRGVVAGDDRKLTQAGNVAGATGAPPYRVIDGSNDYFDFAANAIKNILIGTTWTFVLKMADLTSWTGISYFALFSDGTREVLLRKDETTDKFEVRVKDQGGTARLNTVNTVGTMGAAEQAGDVYVCVWNDGSNCKAGIAFTKPSGLSDFNSDYVVSGNSCDMGAAWGTVVDRSLFVDDQYVGNTGYHMGGEAYYTVLSKTCLIDNAA